MEKENFSRCSGRAATTILFETQPIFIGDLMKLNRTAETVLRKRYLLKDDEGNVIETPEEMCWRVAKAIAKAEENYGNDVEKWAEKFFRLLWEQKFMPNSPTLMNAGTELNQLSACFVIPVEDSIDGIFKALWDMARVQKSGGGTGFSFSRLRPKGDIVKSTMGVASGPVSFMKIFDAATEQIKQGGKRRGANMGVLNVHHPDIEEFITAKWEEGVLRNFNISVAATDAFIEALKNDEDYELINPRTGEVIRKIPARKIFNLIVEGAWRNGEPGMVFIDTINRHNPTPHIGQIEATNPCGEQPLLPYESCNLGSINLAKFVKDGVIDWGGLKETVWTAVRFLDDVIDVNSYPIPEIEQMTKANRKIGLGVMGWADVLFLLGIPYDSEEALQLAEDVMKFIQEESHKASQHLAEERGVFPNWKGSVWEKKGMKMRNATTTTIAPTGTISIIAGCSSGIEPVFALAYKRMNILDGEEFFEINEIFENVLRERGIYSEELIEKVANEGSIQGMDEIPEDIRRVFKCALDISPEWHVRMQAAFQKYTDNAVSKTINLPNSASRKDVEKAFLLAYELGCKGITVYRDGSREEQVLRVKKAEEEKKEREAKPRPPAKYIEPRPRPRITTGRTIETRTGCGSLYVTINEDEYGIAEVFVQLGKSGGCAASQTEAMGRLLSIALRSWIDPEVLIRQLKNIRCPSPGFDNGEVITSCADGVAKVLEKHLKGEYKKIRFEVEGIKPLTEFAEGEEKEERTKQIGGVCPECGNVLEYGEGCATCKFCGFTRCG
jgi:ribonucleoside-diphosphate reductase alpha chain